MRLMTIALAAALLATRTSSALLPAPTYNSTLLGPGLASMYPVDVTQNASYYFVLDEAGIASLR